MKIAVVLHSDDGQRYGVTVPDLAGCFSAGDSIDDALDSVKEAIELHLEGLLEEGQDIPMITPISQHQNNPDYVGGVWALVEVDTIAFEGEAEKIDIVLMRLFELGGMLHTEIMPVPRTDMHCLDEARLQNYLRDIIKDPELPNTQAEWETRLLGLGFLAEAGGNVYCSIAGLVLFGKNPRLYFKQAGLRVFAFAGAEKEYQALFDKILDGPLVGRWDVTGSGKRLIDGGVIERFVEQVSPFVSQEAAIIDEHFRRESQWFYPMDAIREVVVNALAHRDWTRNVDIEVGIYADRLEVISPGALQNSMTIQKMIAGQRSPRNILIMDVLRDYGYVDYRGMGIRTKVIPLMKRLNHVEPIFEATEDYLKTILPRAR